MKFQNVHISHQDEDKEKLLPNDKDVEKADESPSSSRPSFVFKCYVIASMTFIWTAYTLTIKYTRSTVNPDMMYSSTSVVLCAEILKLVITFAMFYKECNFDSRQFSEQVSKYYINAPRELAKMSVPSFAYALQNNLDFVGLSNLDAGLYQVTTQLKVVSTAFFMMLFLGRKFSTRRWMAITLLMFGVAFVQMNNVSASEANTKRETAENYIVGLSAVLATCVTAGFAGVYFEKMLKDGGSTPFWIRNMQMYSCGVISASIACLTDFSRISDKGFFFGYTDKVWAVVILLGVGGLYISLVMRYLDNLYKSMASAVSIILVVVLSMLIFPDIFIGMYFVLGTICVVLAVLLYNSVNE
ncbi:UDP-galactose translocator 1 [Caenorhabditis elegans]|uniref:UDP-galactose translocator 1 n=1 Tax=Caenorhabditis elegans TaxID=6239 RepID=UGTP1_CAEEL|nr:UDP-galactose translocator 1 [Caenorhabditis elegans]Q02334.2 RecName: Full=UDP-galactose translocator 1 [Caenorhabditis elegans]CCD61726.1 UDP-galactose translocator 1 [Caenorhabditis elegans]|eukprot:NP_498930.1 UDP-galactose translocator 1 [Caenorhabditis elegans]